ncbi:MAG: hypothetical protein WC956_01240 [bacterium]
MSRLDPLFLTPYAIAAAAGFGMLLKALTIDSISRGFSVIDWASRRDL